MGRLVGGDSTGVGVGGEHRADELRPRRGGDCRVCTAILILVAVSTVVLAVLYAQSQSMPGTPGAVPPDYGGVVVTGAQWNVLNASEQVPSGIVLSGHGSCVNCPQAGQAENPLALVVTISNDNATIGATLVSVKPSLAGQFGLIAVYPQLPLPVPPAGVCTVTITLVFEVGVPPGTTENASVFGTLFVNDG